MTPFVPTNEQRHHVELLVGFGLTYEEIASLVVNPRTKKGVSTTTLQRHFPDELAAGAAKVKAKVIGSLVKKACSDDHPQAATCAIFYLKCRAGWRQEEKVVHEIESKTGVLVAPASVTPEEWIESQRKKNAERRCPVGA